jgi:ABC-type transport system involved in multi-copper enzyme maturation permease subunit
VNRVVAIALHTIREAARERVAIVAGVFGISLVAASYVLAPLALGEGKKIVTDFGLAGASLLATLLAITLGSSLLYKELDRRTIYAVLSKPIRRVEFVLGKFLGLWTTSGLLLSAMTGMVLVLLLAVYGNLPWVVLGALALTLIELGIVTSFVVLFSAFTTPGLTALFTAAVLVAGQFAEDILYFGSHGTTPVLKAVTGIVYWLLPHLATFNARGLVTHGMAVPPERLLFAFAYGLLYLGGVFTIGALVFERREFR